MVPQTDDEVVAGLGMGGCEMSIDAMKQALAALEHEAQRGNDDAYRQERNALRAAIEQAQKPVAWMYTSQWKGDERFITRYQSELSTYKADKVWPLYTAPRQWQGLTDEQIEALWLQNSLIQAPDRKRQAFARAIEAKLKERNI